MSEEENMKIPDDQNTHGSDDHQKPGKSSVFDWIAKLNLGSLAVAILLALGVRTFVFAAYKIPSGSMIPTLLVGDQLIVNKASFGLRLPFADTKLIHGDGPQRGDVMVFRYPLDTSIDFIKRTIALPGDKVRLKGRSIWINDEQIRQTAAGSFVYVTEGGVQRTADRYQEEYGAHRYYVLYDQDPMFEPEPTEFVVPPGHYFMMGDNRDRSNDSRSWGFVPERNFEGSPKIIHFSWDGQAHNLRWDRLGEGIK